MAVSGQQEGEIHGGRSNGLAVGCRIFVASLSRQWDTCFFVEPSFYMPFRPGDGTGNQISSQKGALTTFSCHTILVEIVGNVTPLGHITPHRHQVRVELGS